MLDVLSLVTSLAMQELECGKLTYRQAIESAKREVFIRINMNYKEIMEEINNGTKKVN